MIPSRIERDILIEAPVDVVWRAVTEPDQIVLWFSDAAAIDLRAGGEGTLTWGQRATTTPITVRFAVETVERPRLFSFRWAHPEGEQARQGNSMLVEFTLTPEGDERTRLRVVESGHELRAWPDAEKWRYADEHQGGWAEYLDRLAALLAKRQPG